MKKDAPSGTALQLLLLAGCAVVFLGTALATGMLGPRPVRQPA